MAFNLPDHENLYRHSFQIHTSSMNHFQVSQQHNFIVTDNQSKKHVQYYHLKLLTSPLLLMHQKKLQGYRTVTSMLANVCHLFLFLQGRIETDI